MSEPSALHLEGVRIALRERVLFDAITAVIPPGECLTVMGPSGCGKSTLLAFLAGSLDPVFTASGGVRIGATDLTNLPPEARRIGILFQDDLLFPHLSVGANLGFALPESVRPSAARRERIEQALADAGLEGYADRDPASLSGGQRARVAVMRTLSAGPRALLLDEPFSKLDAQLRADFRRFVFDHARASGLPTVLVTHDEADALAAGGPVIRL
ncbi:MAG: transporter-related protein [Xanthomonadaceae bacterium]|nr:transporter-related protein [Xanthomonadaceae bacterium]